VHDEKSYIVVNASNPYLKDNLLKIGDSVLAFDGKRMKNSSIFMQKVLFSKIGTKHSIKIKRGKKVMTLSAVSRKRDGGGAISDTFLEFSGIYFNKKLDVVKLSKYFSEYGLQLGDRLVQVHGVRVKTQDELRKYIQTYKDFSSLLFERRNFEFFVNIK
jgi:S1-C subfamily serine protease